MWFDHNLGYLSARILHQKTKEEEEAEGEEQTEVAKKEEGQPKKGQNENEDGGDGDGEEGHAEAGRWEISRELGKALTLLMDGCYLGSIQGNIPVDQYISERTEILSLGRDLFNLCSRVSFAFGFSSTGHQCSGFKLGGFFFFFHYLQKRDRLTFERWVRKRGNRFKSWKKRYLRLDLNELVYSEKVFPFSFFHLLFFSSLLSPPCGFIRSCSSVSSFFFPCGHKEGGVNVKGRIPLRVILSIERLSPADKKHPHCFVVQTGGRNFLIECDSEKEVERWVRVIESGVQSAQALTIASFVFQSPSPSTAAPVPAAPAAGATAATTPSSTSSAAVGTGSVRKGGAGGRWSAGNPRRESVIVGEEAALAFVGKTVVDVSNPEVRKVLVETVPELVKETRASCSKVLATLLANNVAHFG